MPYLSFRLILLSGVFAWMGCTSTDDHLGDPSAPFISGDPMPYGSNQTTTHEPVVDDAGITDADVVPEDVSPMEPEPRAGA